MKNKQKVNLRTSPETEPDYGVTLKCIYCDIYQSVSGIYVEQHDIDNTNFVCHECQYLCD